MIDITKDEKRTQIKDMLWRLGNSIDKFRHSGHQLDQLLIKIGEATDIINQ